MNRKRKHRNSPKFSVMVTLLLCLPLSGLVFAHEEAGTAVSEALQTIHPLTVQLLKLADAFAKAPAAVQQAKLEELRQTIEARRQALLALMETHPDTVLEVALPEGVRHSLPPDLQAVVEEFATLEGTLTVLIATDFDLQTAQVFYQLKTAAGERLALHFAGSGPDSLSGARVRVHGVKLADQMALAGADSSVETLAAAEAVAASDVRKVAVILFNFLNDTRQPWTPDAVKGITFTAPNSINAYYQEASFGKMALQGLLDVDGARDVYGWYTIPYNNTPCSTGTWAEAAQQAAGINDATGYYSIVYAFPGTSACGWSGLGTTSGGVGNSASSWINGSYSLGVVGHELGHNFRLHHASGLNCKGASGQRIPIGNTTTSCTSTITTNCCTLGEYSDPFDIMGGSYKAHVNNYNKGRLNLLDPTNTQDVTVAGLYTIAPVEFASGGVQSLRIPRDFDSTGKVVTKYYYLEFRQPYGLYFDNFSATDPVVNGVSIRLAPPYTTLSRSWLVDTSPSTSSFTDAPLGLNKTFEDSIKGITVTAKSVSASGAAVDVHFGPIVCTPANPSVTIAPASQWGFPGQTLTYTLTVTNNNTSVCPTATFSVASTLPAGWTQSPAAPSVSVSSGASATQSLSVTAAADAVPGFYTLTETATNTAQASYTASASATFTVQPPDTTPPTVTLTSPANGATLPSKGSATVSAAASDASGIARLELLADGKLLKACTNATSCSVKWSLAKVAAGTHTLTATATDKGGPTPNTASTSITVFK